MNLNTLLSNNKIKQEYVYGGKILEERWRPIWAKHVIEENIKVITCNSFLSMIDDEPNLHNYRTVFSYSNTIKWTRLSIEY